MLPSIAPINTALSGLTAPAPAAGGSKLAPGLSPGLSSALSPGGNGGQGTPFSDLLTDAVRQVDELESQARAAVTGLMTGNGVDVHQAMIATQKADMTFEMALAVRNKAVQAYQQVIGMQF
ncbi:MAG: flagellar hook-basal body complex protein FliE [Terracidiphilus sp.]